MMNCYDTTSCLRLFALFLCAELNDKAEASAAPFPGSLSTTTLSSILCARLKG